MSDLNESDGGEWAMFDYTPEDIKLKLEDLNLKTSLLDEFMGCVEK